jgi:hypothetical protein
MRGKSTTQKELLTNHGFVYFYLLYFFFFLFSTFCVSLPVLLLCFLRVAIDSF